MSENEPIVGALQPMEVITAPSIQTIRTTFGALHRSVDTVTADCRAIAETLRTLGDALHVIAQGAGLGEGAGSFGLIGQPIAGALRAVKGVAGQYVKQQTGIPLTTWTDLVASSSTQFEAYLSELDTVAQLAQGHQAATANEIDPQQAQEEQKFLLDVRWRTQAWKQILSRVAQLSPRSGRASARSHRPKRSSSACGWRQA